MQDTIDNAVEAAQEYPQWQRMIRFAQATVRQEEEAEAAKEAARKRKALDTQNAGLKKALAFFGIEAEPEENLWIVGNYQFYLLSADYHTSQGNNGGVAFKMRVRSIIPETYDDDSGSSRLYGDIDVTWKPPAHKESAARLANVLDWLEDERAAFIAQCEQRRQQPQPTPLPDPVPLIPSIGDELESIMRRIAQQEAQRWQEFGQYGY